MLFYGKKKKNNKRGIIDNKRQQVVSNEYNNDPVISTHYTYFTLIIDVNFFFPLLFFLTKIDIVHGGGENDKNIVL